MDASRPALVSSGDESGHDRDTSPYQLTLSALTNSWRKQAAFNTVVGLSFALVAGPMLALGWTLVMCVADLILQRTYRRLWVNAPNVDSNLGLKWLGWLALVKGLLWYVVPTGFTVLQHSLAGFGFLSVLAVGLTAVSVSTARNSQRVFLIMASLPVTALTCAVAATLGPVQGAGALCATLVLSVALWHIGSGTSAVVSAWNQANAHRLEALQEMQLALARSEMAEARQAEALARAEAASRVKSEFLATMSHEIRTPLNGVLGMAQAMDRDELSSQQRDRLGMITTAGQSLLALLNDLLDLSKIEAGKIELEDGVVDVEALAHDAAMFLPLLQDKDVSYAVTVDPLAQRYWCGDAGRIRQVLHNLISNAVKFSERGAVVVRISEQASALVLRVEDTGIGIAPERHAQVFEPFVQADASTTRRYGGSGLGLSICRELTNLMGGTLDLVSTEGVGSTFTVTLPLRPAARPEVIHAGEAYEAPAVGGLSVLAAEDNPMNRLVLQTLLEASGIQPVLVENGEEAVEAFKTGNWDLILMDIQMPVMDGLVATRRIRALERDSGASPTPIIALTANAMNHHRDEYLSAGMDALVPKPINLEALLKTMGAVLELAASPHEPQDRLRGANTPYERDALLAAFRDKQGAAI